MRMSFGKHKGKHVAVVVFDHPDYLFWMKNQGMTNKVEYQYAEKVIDAFDKKPFIKEKCRGRCGKISTRISLYNNTLDTGMYWCDDCDPYDNGARRGMLSIVKTYKDVAMKRYATEILKSLSNAKGVPTRRTDKALKDFFGF